MQSAINDENSDDELELANNYKLIRKTKTLSQNFDQDGTAEVREPLVLGQSVDIGIDVELNVPIG